MKISKSIPMPDRVAQTRYCTGNRKWDFSRIVVGDSVHFTDEAEVRSFRQSFRAYCRSRGLRHTLARGGRVSASSDPDGDGWRIWFVSAHDEQEEI